MTRSISHVAKIAILIALLASHVLVVNGQSGINVPLTVQEALYGGVGGVNRSNEPFCMGIPLADSSGVTATSSLGLTGANAGQFRVLGRWPSGNAKWVKVCGIVPSLSAGSTASVTLTGGSGNFGGASLATDGGTSISVATGAATFTIKKQNFNVLDSVVVGSTPVVASSTAATRGLVVTGPDPTAAFPANVTCGTCTTLYSSANDPNSTAVIEENGPVMTVIKATGNHMSASGAAYMQYTARLYFYRGKATVKTVVTLRNANYDTSATPSPDRAGNTFNTAFKGMQAYEIRIAPNIGGTLTFTMDANGTQTGTLDATGGTDSAYLYQGLSNWMVPMQDTFICAPTSDCANTYTRDTGFVARKNSTTLATGSATQYPQGWADISNASGAGVTIGLYQFAAQWPASLEFNGGGTDVRVGLFSGRNSQPVYQAWPVWQTKEAVLAFHAARPTSFAAEFLAVQHALVARASRTHYNQTGVFPYRIPDSAQEDAFYASLSTGTNPAIQPSAFCYAGASTNCTPDRSANDSNIISNGMAIGIYRAYVWPTGGPMNQEEFRWSDLLRFLQRGQTGRWVNSAQFYRFAADRGLIAHADGRSRTDSTVNNFRWRDRPRANSGSPEVNSRGLPQVACLGVDSYPTPCSTITNSDKSVVSWSFGDYLHNHYSGIFDYYFLTGDEGIREAVLPVKDYYLNNNTYQGVTDPAASTGFPTRAVGIELIGASNFSAYLSAINDPDAAGVLDQAKGAFLKHVKTDTCVSGFPTGCTAPPANSYPNLPDNEPAGVNRKRGVHTSNSFRGSYFCTDAANPYGIPAYYRAQSAFQASILIEGLLSLARVAGPSWTDYNLARDLAYGVGQWGLSEAFSDNGENRWFVGGGTQQIDSLYNGFRFGVQFDHGQICPASTTVTPTVTTSIGGNIYNNVTLADAVQGHWMLFYAHAVMNGGLSQAEVRKLKLGLDWVGVRRSVWPPDYGGYQLGALIDSISTTQAESLQDVPFTVANLGGGAYRLSWTVPANTRSYRIKWSPLAIAPSTGLLNFNPITNTFGMNPNQYDTWFGANSVSEPAPAAAGTTQTFDISGTGNSALAAQSFSVKAYVAGASGTSAPPPTPPAAPSQVRNVRVVSTAPPTTPPPPPPAAGATWPPTTDPNADITWNLMPRTTGWPGYDGWISLWFDTVSQQMIHYGVVAGSTSIYSSDVFSYKASTNAWTHIGGTGSLGDRCPASTPTQPGDRHPGWQMAIDTKRNVLWLYGGVCQGTNRQDMYFLRLNASPAQNTWQQVTPARYPVPNNSAAMAYDPNTDVIFLFGSDAAAQTHDNWVYCPANENPTPGVLTAAQTAAGCTSPNNWSEVQTAGGVQPPGVAFPGLVYDTVTRKVLQYGGETGGSIKQNQMWAYDVPTRTWTRKALSSTPPPAYSGSFTAQPAMAYNSLTHKVLFRQTSGAGAPADWQYDPVADTWTKLISSGVGATIDHVMTYDPVNNRYLTFSMDPNNGAATVWQGLPR